MSSPSPPYSPTRRAGPWIVVSGQIGMIDGELVTGGVVSETRAALENLGSRLSEHEASLDDVVKTTAFLCDMADFDAMNAVYSEFFSAPFPARSAVAVAELPFGAQLEIEAWAYVEG